VQEWIRDANRYSYLTCQFSSWKGSLQSASIFLERSSFGLPFCHMNLECFGMYFIHGCMRVFFVLVEILDAIWAVDRHLSTLLSTFIVILLFISALQRQIDTGICIPYQLHMKLVDIATFIKVYFFTFRNTLLKFLCKFKWRSYHF
jgi:hypothetical protein